MPIGKPGTGYWSNTGWVEGGNSANDRSYSALTAIGATSSNNFTPTVSVPVSKPAPVSVVTSNSGGGSSSSSYNGSSIVDALKAVGQDSSYAARAALAAKIGIVNYTGTADQNTQLLNSLRNAQVDSTVKNTNQNISSSPGTPQTPQTGLANLPSTGDSNLDALQTQFANAITGSLAQGFTINPALSITPDTVKQFMTETASQLEPRYQQTLAQEMININQAVNQLTVQYQNQQGQTVQDFQQSLGNLRDQSSMAGGGERAMELGLMNSANRSLSTLDVNASTAIGQQLQQGGQALGQGLFSPILSATGSAPTALAPYTASGINTPSLSGKQVGLQGGDSVFAGSANQGNALNFNFNPSMYKYGSIPGQYSNDFTDLLNQTASNYLKGMAATGKTNQIVSSYGNTLGL